ncbi:MAG: DUF3488 domain-containing protein [Oscillatoriales cyanobacterium RM2_1_1]|nr:DUF3488 domain-containing protein [Oscillatoriales cyanobacterium RM2_1_1]
MTTSIPLISQIRHRLATGPKSQPENSISLRIAVQLLVIVGIIATDVAIEEPLNLWAIPVSIVGATWSGCRRHHRNVPIKFCIAIGMLIALGAFFARLVGELNDTRVALAILLIHLQVLHSFDLPRRQDLGYSMVIGLILMGVAATLSQTLTFGPLVLVFLAIALPTLVLDYRSRLGLSQFRWRHKSGQPTQPPGSSGLNLKFLALSFIAIVALGLLIFALLPRLPGYQLRSFPVSAPLEMPEGQFDTSRVFNPGYVDGGKDGQSDTGSARGRSPRSGRGELSSTFYSGFDTQINQNLRGQMDPQIVMRVRSQARGFWRVVAFDEYTGQGWGISRNDKTYTLRRPWWTYQFRLLPPLTQAKTQEVVQSYTIVSQLPNLLPAMPWATEVYYPTEELAIDPEGTLRSPLELREGMTYTVISEVPYRDRAALSQAKTTYPKRIRDFYLQVPGDIQAKVRQKTEEILANPNRVAQNDKSLDSPYEKALFLAQYLKQNPLYKLQEAPPFLQDDEDLVEAFLFGYKESPPGNLVTGGYPDHFATVLTIMLRSIGIPARLVAGFEPGEFNPFTGLYIVRNTDAHAMAEVYFPEYGWFAFNPIPGMDLIPPSVEENQTFSALQAFWKWIAGWLPSPVTGALQTIFGAIIGVLVGSLRWFFNLFSQGWLGILLGLVSATAIAFLAWLGWEGWKTWRYRRWLTKLPIEEGLYQQMLQLLATKGYPKLAVQTPTEYSKAVGSHQSIDEAEVIDEISQTYVRWRYGGQPSNLAQLRQLVHNLKKAQLKSFKSRFKRPLRFKDSA